MLFRVKITCITLLLWAITATSQAQELTSHIRLVQRLMPNATRIGLVYSPNADLRADIQAATTETGMRVVTAEVGSIRDLAKAVRSLDPYDVDFIILSEERVTSGTSAIKFVVKQAARKKIPVFSTAEAALPAGAFGRFIQDQSQWKIRINGKVLSRFDIQVPDSEVFIIEE